MKARVAAIVVMGLAGCARSPAARPTRATRAMDPFEKLDGLRTRLASEQVPCGERCAGAREGCELARGVCDRLAPDASADDDRRCGAAQEDCAGFNDGCARCGKR